MSRWQSESTDRVCVSFAPCSENEYVFQALEDDDNGFLRKPLICKSYSVCKSEEEYTLVNGRAYGDRDYVCARYTKCATGLQYALVKQTDTSDNVCRDFTVCNPDYQFLLQKGNPFRDNVCATKTRCTAQSFRSMFELVPPRDAVSETVNGSDAVCKNYTTCGDGQDVAFVGSDTKDHDCVPCSVGNYRNASLSFQVTHLAADFALMRDILHLKTKCAIFDDLALMK
jgi:hypothetical protein